MFSEYIARWGRVFVGYQVCAVACQAPVFLLLLLRLAASKSGNIFVSASIFFQVAPTATIFSGVSVIADIEMNTVRGKTSQH